LHFVKQVVLVFPAAAGTTATGRIEWSLMRPHDKIAQVFARSRPEVIVVDPEANVIEGAN
jgi:hypothetical protein